MARRVYVDEPVTTAADPTPGADAGVVLSNVVTALYVAIIAVIGIDALLQATNANEANGFVRLMDTLSAPFLAPFTNMFDDQRYLATALIAAAVYTAAYLILMAVLRRGRRTVL